MIIDKSNIDQFIKGTNLKFHNKGITSIESIPDHITHIYCYGNKLTSLPKLPTGLEYLDCDNNNLTSLPMLPDSLLFLYCRNNQLASYPYSSVDKQWWVNYNNHLKILHRSTIINKICE